MTHNHAHASHEPATDNTAHPRARTHTYARAGTQTCGRRED